MAEDRNSYGSIVKSISLFGGVKVFQILVSIIRTKIIALLIGANGMGIYSLYMSLTDIVSTITGCGIQTSAVRDVSKAYSNKDEDKINKTVTCVRKLVLITGSIGTLFVFFFSTFLSNLVFDCPYYSNSIKIVSVILLFNQINVGQTVLIQSTFRYKDLARSSLFGNICVLIISFPIYYFLRERGIVFSIITASVVTLLFSTYYSRQIPYKRVSLTIKDFWSKSKTIIQVGAVLAVSGLMSRLSGFIINLFLSRVGSLEIVGLYSSGYNLINSYVFIIFSAMTTDYVPRLSLVSDDNQKLSDLVNRQAILLVTLITPLLIGMCVFVKQVMLLLYSEEFLAACTFMQFTLFGMFFRAISWSMSYAFVAKGGSKMFLINEMLICFISVGLKIIGYYFYGLEGIGIAFILTYVWYTIQLYLFLHKKTEFSFTMEFMKIGLIMLPLCVVSIVFLQMNISDIWKYSLGSIFFIISLYVSYKVLDQRIGISAFINRLLKRKA